MGISNGPKSGVQSDEIAVGRGLGRTGVEMKGCEEVKRSCDSPVLRCRSLSRRVRRNYNSYTHASTSDLLWTSFESSRGYMQTKAKAV